MIWRWVRARARRRRLRRQDDFSHVTERTRDLEIRAHRILGGLAAGSWASLFRGSGTVPDSVRPYQDGDSIRVVDWRVTAKRGGLHVREFVDERGLDVVLVVDRSGSLLASAGPAGRVAVEAAAALAMASSRSGHRFGLMQVTDRVEQFVRPATGDVHLRRVLSDMISLEPEGWGTDLPQALHTAAAVSPTGSLFVVVSDFRCPGPDRRKLTSAVARLAAHGSVLLVRVMSPGLLELPEVGLLEIVDPETGQLTTYDSGSRREKDHLRILEGVWQQWWEELCEVGRGAPVTLDVREPLDGQLRRGLSRAGRAIA